MTYFSANRDERCAHCRSCERHTEEEHLAYVHQAAATEADLVRAASVAYSRELEVGARAFGYFDVADLHRQMGDALEKSSTPLTCEVPLISVLGRLEE